MSQSILFAQMQFCSTSRRLINFECCRVCAWTSLQSSRSETRCTLYQQCCEPFRLHGAAVSPNETSVICRVSNTAEVTETSRARSIWQSESNKIATVMNNIHQFSTEAEAYQIATSMFPTISTSILSLTMSW